MELDKEDPIVSQPGFILWSSPKSSNLLLPRQNLSIIWYISAGFSVEPSGGSSSTITSVSILAWIKWESEALRTSPFKPTRQCSFILCRIPYPLQPT